MKARARQDGAALLLVMWLIALLASLIGAFALGARVERLQERVLSRGVIAGEAARAGLEMALVRVGDPDQRRRWVPDGRTYHWQYDGIPVDVQVTDEQGKVDINAADPALLAALFKAVEVPGNQADRLAAAMVDWRDADSLTQAEGGAEDPQYEEAGLPYGAKDAPFETIAEAEQVLGMTPAIYARVRDYLTVYTGQGTPDQAFAAAPVLTAMGLDGDALVKARQAQRSATGAALDPAAMGGGGSGTYSIQSVARLREGRTAGIRGVVRSGGNGAPGSAYTALDWEEGTTAR
ncbi:general secretion pathway protein GspK [Cognatiluteimonas profundi]|uniref:general secretion pathway protein GspK n=1 Tax=Cognatiluteimonas profundi TaxID=2594501 RepID=UPI00131EA30D|nr:type II secretion system protein GspK [Lysobacter profundi]